MEQADLTVVNDKRKYTQQVVDKKTGKAIYVDVEEIVPKTVETDKVNKAELKQIASALKDLKDLFTTTNDNQTASPNINITVTAATVEDMEDNEE